MNVRMAHCPHCGVELLESLVRSVRDPNQSESCPRVERLPGRVTADTDLLSVAAAAIQARVAQSLANILPAPTRVGTGRYRNANGRPVPPDSQLAVESRTRT